jgi:aryl-alcohol dehydrogenase-like predicted oxidoreductase
MPTPRFDDLKPSRLTLGAVQLGMPYGIANVTGQPSYEQAREILACAVEGGITCVDTAAAYGNSEEVLGRAIAELGIADWLLVVTKVPALDDSLTAKAAERQIEAAVARSLQRLRLERLHLCLFHREKDFRYAETLQRLQSRGLIHALGCSMETPEAADTVFASGEADAMQVPGNLLDRRFLQADYGTHPHSRPTLFVRSVFLQGLLLMPPERIPAGLSEAIPALRALRGLAEAAGMSLEEMAIRYVLSYRGVASALIGVETVAQMRRALSFLKSDPLDDAMMQAIHETAPALPERVIVPHLWEWKQE